jgi:hypothetical protein
LVYVARVRNGFVPASRCQLFEKLKLLVISKCPFVNLPEKHRSRWGEGMTVDGTAGPGVDIVIRYITRAGVRVETRNHLFAMIVELTQSVSKEDKNLAPISRMGD